LATRVQQLFAAATGDSTRQWTPLREALLATDDPLKMISWIKHSPTARLLRQVIAVQSPVTHEMLDELPHRSPVHDVRDLLISCGVLPLRDAEYLQRIHPWLRDALAPLPPLSTLVFSPSTSAGMCCRKRSELWPAAASATACRRPSRRTSMRPRGS
jgi:hypothetical protein